MKKPRREKAVAEKESEYADEMDEEADMSVTGATSAHASECLLLRLIHGLYEDCEGGVQRYRVLVSRVKYTASGALHSVY